MGIPTKSPQKQLSIFINVTEINLLRFISKEKFEITTLTVSLVKT